METSNLKNWFHRQKEFDKSNWDLILVSEGTMGRNQFLKENNGKQPLHPLNMLRIQIDM